MLAMGYENVYIAKVAYGAKDTQTLRAFIDAAAHDGPSLIIAYSPCIAHGVDLAHNHRQQNLAVKSGHWPLFRYEPARAEKGMNHCVWILPHRRLITPISARMRPASVCSIVLIQRRPSSISSKLKTM